MHAKSLKAALFNHTTLLDSYYDEALAGQIKRMLEGLKDLGLRVVALSTHSEPLESLRATYGSLIDLTLDRDAVGKNKGSDAWVLEACARLGLAPSQVFYVGDTVWDWRTAVNARVFYLEAGWSRRPRGRGARRVLIVRQPGFVLPFARYVLVPAPFWAYAEDFDDEPVRLRVLLPHDARLRSDAGVFTVQDVFTYEKEIQVAGLPANTMLLALVVISLLREGLFDVREERSMPIFAPYPGSSRGSTTKLFDDPLELLASYTKGYYFPDLLLRKLNAKDKSLLRAKRARGEPVSLPTIENEAGTLVLNTEYGEKVRSRRVVVLDDFTTTGMSLEWAKTLLLSAGAAEVTMVAVGKYPKPHDRYRFDGEVDPYDLNKNKKLQPLPLSLRLEKDENAAERVKRAFEVLASL